MQYKKICSLLLCAGLLLPFAVSAKTTPEKEISHIALISVHLLRSKHYVKRECSPENSMKFFNNYLKELDPQRMFFTKKEIDTWTPSGRWLFSKISDSGDCSFAFYVFSRYLSRLREYEKFVNNLKLTDADLNTNDHYVFDRKKADWPANEEEMRQIWKKKIRNEIIILKILDRIDAEDKETKKENAWKKKTPIERVRQRISMFVKTASKYEKLEILEFYLNSLAAVYDPHTVYMAPKNEEEFNITMRLSLIGIGAVLTTSDEGYTRIVEIMPGGPADKCGQLKANDRIIAVQQKGEQPVDIIDMPLSKVVSMIRGKEGTTVILTVIDGAKGPASAPKKITLIRKKIEIKESEAHGEIKTIQGKKIGVITLPSFYMDFEAAYSGDKNYKSSTRDVKKLISDFKKKGIDGLIIDLRSNGGGALPEAISLTGLFIKSGPVVQIRSADGSIEVENDDDGGAVEYEGPLAIMTNKLSASASEIFAGAIRDHNRGIIIGDSKTHGKGTVQTVEELNRIFSFFRKNVKAGMLKYTNAKYYRVNGESTQLRGVEPDIAYPSFSDSMELGEDKLDSPMAWDKIDKAADYQPEKTDLDRKITILRAKSAKRIRTSPEFKMLLRSIARFAETKKQKTVVLNLEKRWKEYQEEKKLHEQQAKLMNLDSDGKTSKESKKNKEKDIYLNEALNIVSDFIDLQKGK